MRIPPIVRFLPAASFAAVALAIAGPVAAATPEQQLAEVSSCLHKRTPAPAWGFYEYVTDSRASRDSSSKPRAWVKSPVLLFGDMDGGFGRTVLSAMRAGMVSLPDAKREKLCELLVLEAESIRDTGGHSLEKYQASREAGERQERLLRALTYRNVPKGSVVWLGDIVMDRLTNDLPSMDKLLRRLHAHGALFIRGNHEEYYRPPGSEKKCTSTSWGCFAQSRSRYSTAEFDSLVKAVFVNALYDPVNRLFMSHNGVEKSSENPDVLKTAFGDLADYRSRSPEQVAAWMREQPVNASRFTSFRPTDASMEYTVIGDGSERAVQAHGHNACFFMENAWVLALNPRLGPRCHTYTASAWQLRPGG